MADFLASALQSVPAAGWQRLLLDAIWQSTLVGMVGLLVARLVVRQAAARAWLLLLFMTASVVVPIASWSARQAGWTMLRSTATAVDGGFRDSSVPKPLPTDRATTHYSDRGSAQRAAVRDGSVTTHPRADAEAAPWSRPTDQPSAEVASVPSRTGRAPAGSLLLEAVGIVWLICSLFLLTRLIASVIIVNRIVWRAKRCDDQRIMAAVSEASSRIGLADAPRVLQSDLIHTPMVLAFLRPTLLLPAGDAMRTTSRHWVTVFAHELAHIRRGDGWTRLWAHFVTILLPLQPLSWRLRRSFLTACEEACDDWAVSTGSDPLDLASVLTVWAERARGQRTLLLTAGVSSTRARTLRLLAMRGAPTTTLAPRWRLSGTALAIIVCGGLAIAQPPSAKEQPAVPEPSAPSPTTTETQGQTLESAPQVTRSAESQYTITGICVDENKQPLANARVRLFYLGLQSPSGGVTSANLMQSELKDTRTDEKGSFTFSSLEPGREGDTNYIVVAQVSGKATAYQPVITDSSGTQRITLELPAAASLKGRVVNEVGTPVAGAFVSAACCLVKPVPGICTSISDAEGNFAITDLRPFNLDDQEPRSVDGEFVDRIGAVFGRVEHSDYGRNLFSYSTIPGEVVITVKRPATVTGKIVLKESGEPAAGAQIEFSNDKVGSDYWTRAIADDQGNYEVADLPPGEYRASVQFAGRPNLFEPAIELSVGANRRDFQIGQGGIISGRVVDVTTNSAVELATGERMQISESRHDGVWHAGMNSAWIEPDGTFLLSLPAGRQHLGMHLGQNWRGVNTDRLLLEGIEVVEGQTTELEVRVKPRNREDEKPPTPLSRDAAADLAEKTAVAAIKQLGGWVTFESIDGNEHVVEVNMVYHEDEQMGREENRLILDECLTYIPKFPKLKRLLLWHEQATDPGLAHLRGMESLEEIFLWHASEVTDTGAAHLATLPNLRKIHLSNSKITDETLQHFGRLPRIEELSLQGDRFTDQGLESLQGATQLKTLWLGLGDNRVTDAGLRHLSELTKLESLGLQKSDVTDQGLRHLHSLKNLKQLWISGPRITEEGKNELRKALPNTEIH